MDPHLIPATSVKDDGASMAMAEQDRLLHVMEKLFTLHVMVVLQAGRLWNLVKWNLCMCGHDKAMGSSAARIRSVNVREGKLRRVVVAGSVPVVDKLM